jgi:hydrogenase nickel incorporation protein HypB
MCESCGCGDPAVMPVEVHERILGVNDAQARHNREHFAASGVLAINVMGSPGAGKTALLEATAKRLSSWRMGALAGDLATDHDAARLEAAGIPSVSITTGSACHLDAGMVHHALHATGWTGLDCLFIENVGNLVCPAVYDLGQAANVVCLSVTEGEDKPLKYPVMFRGADLVLVTKCDLLPHLSVSMPRIKDALARVMPTPAAIGLSATKGDGVDAWIAWLVRERDRVRAAHAQAQHHHATHAHSHA